MKNNELDGVTSHIAKLWQNWCKENCSAFIKKDEWPPSLPDLNPLNFSIWSILEANVNETPHKNLALLKRKLLIKWEKIPLSVICTSINAFPKPLLQIIDKGDILNKHTGIYFFNINRKH